MSRQMNDLRAATPEEIASIANHSDLGFCEHQIMALDNANGTVNLFVLKKEWVLDPIWFDASVGKNMRSMILWMLNNVIKGMGIPCYYFGVHDDEEGRAFKDSMIHHGAELATPVPEWKLKKVLVDQPKKKEPEKAQEAKA